MGNIIMDSMRAQEYHITQCIVRLSFFTLFHLPLRQQNLHTSTVDNLKPNNQ